MGCTSPRQTVAATIFAIALAMVIPVYGGGITRLFDDEHHLGGWRGFGFGLAEIMIHREENEVILNVSWSQSDWGVGMMYSTQNHEFGETHEGIRMEIKTLKGTKTRVSVGLLITDFRDLELSRQRTIAITDIWQVISIPFADLNCVFKNNTVRISGDYLWRSVQAIKIVFIKPDPLQIGHDYIMIRKPSLYDCSESRSAGTTGG